MFAGAVESLRDNLAGRAMTRITNLRAVEEVKNRIGELITTGPPIVYANHQSHADGIALVVIAEYLRNLAVEIPNSYALKGLGLLFATSMMSGDQGDDLARIYDLLKNSAQRKGAESIPVTRIKDAKQYGLGRERVVRETRLIIGSLQEGYGIGFLPEGRVEGGRHLKGESREKIKGIQDIENNNLIDIFRLAKKAVNPKKAIPFYQPVALHGSFRILECPEGGKPHLTSKGALSLFMAALGLPCPLKIQATLLMPFVEEEIVADLGANWMKDGPALNRYAMTKLKAGLPPDITPLR